MRLFEAIIDANHRAVGGDQGAGVRVADYEAELPVVALTCVDARLNAILPNVLGLPADQFIWLRNAGNIITGPVSSTMRSLALACAIKGGRSIAIIGHTDCQVGKTTTMQLLERFKDLGIERHVLPENINEFFGAFGSEQQNVLKACDIVRHSPLIGPKVPVHGLLVNLDTGKVDWLVNGYQTFGTAAARWNEVVKSAGQTVDALKGLADFQIGEMKFPETKIGEAVTQGGNWLSQQIGQLEIKPAETPGPLSTAAQMAGKIIETAQKHLPKTDPAKPPATPPKLPLPARVRPRLHMKRGGGK